MEQCPNCKNRVQINFEKCPSCFVFLWYPNVKKAKLPEHKDALEKRYWDALDRCTVSGAENKAKEFEAEMKNSFAVITMDESLFLQFLRKDNKLYTNHTIQLENSEISLKKPEQEEERSSVEAKLFSRYARKIRYVALSLDGIGLSYYGKVTVKLKSTYISHRASLIEDDSMVFMDKHKVFISGKIPEGYIVEWGDREKLAVAKLADKISEKTRKEDFPKILLEDRGGNFNDRFIEVHIYGTINNFGFDSVKLRALGSGELAVELRDILAKKNIPFEDV